MLPKTLYNYIPCFFIRHPMGYKHKTKEKNERNILPNVMYKHGYFSK